MNERSAHTPPMLSVEQAHERIERLIEPLSETESIDTARARGRILAADVTADLDIPPWRNSAMDGYAVRSADLPVDSPELTVAGTSLAGRPWRGTLAPGQCLRIMTGAPVPDGADAVIIQENAERDGDRVRFKTGAEPGQNVRDAGEDIRNGERVFRRGRRLNAADLGVLASLGQASVEVFRPVRVCYFTSGDELRSPGEPLGFGELYNSNRYALAGLLQQPGVDAQYAGNLPDEPDVLRAQLTAAAAGADMVITCGGVSVGEADHITGVLEAIGDIEFARIAVKPGKPLNFGRLDSAVFFGLPGNPVSAVITFALFVRPALRKLAGEQPIEPPTPLPARLEIPVHKKPGRAEYQRGVASRMPDGSLQVRPAGPQGSHQLSSLSAANCLIALNADCGGLPAGGAVNVLQLEELL